MGKKYHYFRQKENTEKMNADTPKLTSPKFESPQFEKRDKKVCFFLSF